MTEPVLITVEHPADCLTCEIRIEFGEAAWWVSGVGIWHKVCHQPVNLATYIKEAQAKRPTTRCPLCHQSYSVVDKAAIAQHRQGRCIRKE